MSNTILTGLEVRSLREKFGITQTRLAILANVSGAQVQRYERRGDSSDVGALLTRALIAYTPQQQPRKEAPTAEARARVSSVPKFSARCEWCGKEPAEENDILCNRCVRLHPETLIGGVMSGGGPDPDRIRAGVEWCAGFMGATS